ncbi:uncharacterized protein LOC130220842 [Danio aesculapii]|uniref:uncharacterized protein LOC130220842 n=1 Tax=Danio aesculapii TaxID=1142201 RepID=UPI0024BF33B0|nr:uncharacterized protein LOC130220842 [Danio aesculapii]
MDIITCIFMSLCLLLVADGLAVRGPSAPLSAPLGYSVVLPCYVDEALPVEDLEVEWRRADSETLIHLYQDGESRPEAQQQDYHDRAHFFTEEIQHGNFSLRLDNLRAQDRGQYRCKVYSQQDSGETVVQIKVVKRLLGSNRPTSAYVGEDVTLNCSVDSHITHEHVEEVLWLKTDEDKKKILVLPFQNNKIFPDSSDEQFRGRVEFFTAEIPKGFFSLHIAVLVLCVAAGSGAVLLLCCLIYCRLNTVSSSRICNLQLSLVFFPNVCMFLAFILWGFTEGSLHETITCSALYILRPLMLIWALSYLKYLQESLKPWISYFTPTREFAVFTLVVYSVLFSYGWRKRAHDADITHLLIFGGYTAILVLICLIFTTQDILRIFCRKQQGERIQTTGHVCFPLGILDFILYVTCMSFSLCPPAKCHCRAWFAVLWIITILVLNIVLVMYTHLGLLEGDKERLGWICVISFNEILKMIAILLQAKELLERRRQQRQTSEQKSVSLCNELMYMFGAVGLVLLSSVSLTVELILKALNGERVIGDLRVIVFPSESAFVLYWLLLQMHAYWKVLTSGSTDSLSDSSQRHQHESTTEM